MNKITTYTISIIAVLTMLLGTTTVNATAPRLIPFEGIIEHNSNQMDGPVDITFYLCPIPSGQAPVLVESNCWHEDHFASNDDAVTVNSGRFSVIIGATQNPKGVPEYVFGQAGVDMYIAMAVNEVTLNNMQKIVSTPYAVRSRETDALPPGMIMPFYGNVAPEGWLLADGNLFAYPREEYDCAWATAQLGADVLCDLKYKNLIDHLINLAGLTHDDHPYPIYTTPDMRGRFLRGKGGSTSINPESQDLDIGDTQNDAFQGHMHRLVTINGGTKYYQGADSDYDVHASVNGEGISYVRNRQSRESYSEIPTYRRFYADDVVSNGNGTPNESSETRPTNMTVNYLIKY